MATTPNSNRFFEWIRGLALDRQPGWLGGVCAGLAARIGIDPVIVRGIVVVVAVLGGPVVLLYSLAWLLLPAREGSLHLENLVKGTIDRAVAGIVVLFLLALLPLTQGFWYLGSVFWSDPYGFGSFGASAGRAVWTLGLIIVGIWFVVWIARRGARGAEGVKGVDAAAPDLAAPDTAAPDTAAPEVASPSAAASHGSPTELRPEPPAALSPDPTTDELADWKNRQAEWKLRFDTWKREQAALTREQRLARATEARERANTSASARSERVRGRRAANPRLRFGFVAIALGAALLAGGIAALSASATPWAGAPATVGCAAATLVIGVTMIIAGACRRRVGFLGIIVAILTIATVSAAFLPTDRTLLFSGAHIDTVRSGRYALVNGTLSIGYSDLNAAEKNGGIIDVWQGHGDTWINLPRGTTVRLEATTVLGRAYADTAVKDSEGNFTTDVTQLISTSLADGSQRYEQTLGAGPHHITIRIWQGAGSINVDDQSAAVDDGSSAATDNSEEGNQ